MVLYRRMKKSINTSSRTHGLCFKALLGIIFWLLVALENHLLGNIAQTSSSIDTNQIDMQTNSQQVPASKTKFVFFVGIEGVGHHLIKDIASQSPDVKELGELGLADTHFKLAKSYMQLQLQIPAPETPENTVCDSTDSNNAYPLFVDLLTSIANKASNRSVAPSFLTIPVNCVSRNTMASYPDSPRRKPCVDIPNIDLFYQACNQVGVGVECQHVFVYRDLHSVIKSTSSSKKRKFNSSVRDAILLYTSVLKYLYTALSKHSTKLAACLAVLDPDPTNEKVWYPLADMLGWKDGHSEFDEFLNSTYRSPKPLSLQDRKRIVPSELEDEMEEFRRAQEHIMSLCPNHRKSVVENAQ